MIDREKVIKGLECCVTSYCPDECPYVDECGTNVANGEMIKPLLEDALALLKPEPRVLSLDELHLNRVFNAFEEKAVIAFETSGIYKDSYYNGCEMIAVLATTATMEDWEEKESEYGRTWRCWSSRPTDEQMEAVKWE